MTGVPSSRIHRAHAAHAAHARLAAQAILVSVLSVLMAGVTFAGDDRPTEIVYDTPGAIPDLRPNYRRGEESKIVITDNVVEPRTLRVEQGKPIAWVSYSRAGSAIVFEREVARSMVCHGLINFSLRDDELRSADLYPGEEASFCELKPGRYHYRVIRTGHARQQSTEATRRMVGWIEVLPVEAAQAEDGEDFPATAANLR